MMSKCSKKCNDICKKIKSISGLDDDFVYGLLTTLENETDVIVEAINKYADQNKYNGSCFKWEI